MQVLNKDEVVRELQAAVLQQLTTGAAWVRKLAARAVAEIFLVRSLH